MCGAAAVTAGRTARIGISSGAVAGAATAGAAATGAAARQPRPAQCRGRRTRASRQQTGQRRSGGHQRREISRERQAVRQQSSCGARPQARRAARRVQRARRQPGSAAGGCGRVTDAVAVWRGGCGGGRRGGRGPRRASDVKPCMSCVAAAGLVASCWRNGRPGTPGAGAGAAGSASRGAAQRQRDRDRARRGDHRWWRTVFW